MVAAAAHITGRGVPPGPLALPPDALRRALSFLTLPELLAARTTCSVWRGAARSASHIYHRKPVTKRGVGTLGTVFPRASSVRLICSGAMKLDQILRALLVTPPDADAPSPVTSPYRAHHPPGAALHLARAAGVPPARVEAGTAGAGAGAGAGCGGGGGGAGGAGTAAIRPPVRVSASLLSLRPAVGAVAVAVPRPSPPHLPPAPPHPGAAATSPASVPLSAFAPARPALGHPLGSEARFTTPDRPRPSARRTPGRTHGSFGSPFRTPYSTPGSAATVASATSHRSSVWQVGAAPLRPRLRGLRLTNVVVDDTAVALLVTVAAPLRQLRLSGRWQVSPVALDTLMRSLSQLQALDLTGCHGFTDAHVATLMRQDAGGGAGGECGPTLRKLACDSRCLVSPVLPCPNLVSLSLARCTRLTSPRINAPRLGWLSLAYCRQLTSEALHGLLQVLPRLRYLDARGCGALKVGGSPPPRVVWW